MSPVLTAIFGLPWAKIIGFIISMAGWWKSASDEKKDKVIKQLEAINEIFKQGGDISNITDGWDDINRL